MRSLFKQIYRYTHPRSMRHNETLWPYMKVTRALSGEIVSVSYKGLPVPLADLSQLYKSCSGQLLLTATGPSIKSIHFDKVSPPEISMGVNGAYYLQKHINFLFYVIVDMGFFDQKMILIAEIISNHEITLFTTAHGLARLIDRKGLDAIKCKIALIEDASCKIYCDKIAPRFLQAAYADKSCHHFLYGRPDIGFSTDIRQGIFDAGTVIYWALQIAVYLGFNEIFIAGLDMNNFEQPRFYENNNNAEPSYLSNYLEKIIIPAMRHASDIMRQSNVKITNLSLQSAIDDTIFKKADYHVIFS